MRFTILGAGALGTILASHLREDGHEVDCIVRANRAAQLSENGLQLTGLRELNASCNIVTEPASIKNTDVLIIGTKTYQIEAALESVRHIDATAVFSIANGVKKNEQLIAAFGKAATLGCMANVSGELLDNGVVNYTRNVCLHLGALNEDQRRNAEEIAQAIDQSGVVCRARDDITSVEWSKFVGWVAFMCLAVITRARTIDFLLNDNHARLATRLIKEMAQIAESKNIPLVDQSPMPVKTIAEASFDDSLQAILSVGNEFATNAPEHRMSSLQDLERGATLEYADTLGYARALAVELGIAAPTIIDCHDLVAGIDAINSN